MGKGGLWKDRFFFCVLGRRELSAELGEAGCEMKEGGLIAV